MHDIISTFRVNDFPPVKRGEVTKEQAIAELRHDLGTGQNSEIVYDQFDIQTGSGQKWSFEQRRFR